MCHIGFKRRLKSKSTSISSIISRISTIYCSFGIAPETIIACPVAYSGAASG
jgi:hypothetical protein